jgi:hypothetical protein
MLRSPKYANIGHCPNIYVTNPNIYEMKDKQDWAIICFQVPKVLLFQTTMINLSKFTNHQNVQDSKIKTMNPAKALFYRICCVAGHLR